MPAKRERLSLVDFQVRQRLPLVDLKGKRLAIDEQINLRNTDRWTVPEKRERLSLVDFQVKQRLPFADLRETDLLLTDRLTCEILTGVLCLQREREAVIGGFTSETEAAIGSF